MSFTATTAKIVILHIPKSRVVLLYISVESQINTINRLNVPAFLQTATRFLIGIVCYK